MLYNLYYSDSIQNQRKENKHLGIKEDLQWLFWHPPQTKYELCIPRLTLSHA